MEETTLRERINNVRNKYLSEAEKQIGKIIAKEFGAKSVIIRKQVSDYSDDISISVNIDGFKISGIEIDQYNNVTIAKVDLMPTEYLEKVRRLFNEYLEREDSYRHRTGTGFFIEYFEKKYKKLSKKTVQQMCDIDDVDNEGVGEGFRGWLVGDSFTTGGNLSSFDTKWKKEDFKEKTIEPMQEGEDK